MKDNQPNPDAALGENYEGKIVYDVVPTPMTQDPNKALILLENKTLSIIEVLEKLVSRFDAMGKVMMGNHKDLTAKIEELSALLRPMRIGNQSPEIDKLAAAMSAAQAKFGVVNGTATGARGKAYATSGDMIATTAEVLQECGLSASFDVWTDADQKFFITLEVLHTSGQWKKTTCPLREYEVKNEIFHQRLASAETSMRRIMYRSMFNLALE